MYRLRILFLRYSRVDAACVRLQRLRSEILKAHISLKKLQLTSQILYIIFAVTEDFNRPQVGEKCRCLHVCSIFSMPSGTSASQTSKFNGMRRVHPCGARLELVVHSYSACHDTRQFFVVLLTVRHESTRVAIHQRR